MLSVPTDNDLSRLRIERDPKSDGAARRLLWRRGLAAIALGAYFAARAVLDPRITVAVGSVVTAYPSRAYTLFNATGYVVAQRKADVASKATGRLEVSEVKEGSRVVEGQILARRESRDLVAALNRAAAKVSAFRRRLGGLRRRKRG